MTHSTLKSMTAYGRASLSNFLGRFVIEIQSLNRKFLEVNVSLPKDFWRFELDVRKWVAEKISRGQININISYRPDPTESLSLVPNLPLAKSLKKAWEKISNELELKLDSQSFLNLLSTEKDLIYVEEMKREELFYEVLQTIVNDALEKVLYMKKKEGEALQEDIFRRLAFLETQINDIAAKSSQASQKYYLKLKQRLDDLFSSSQSENEEKILREIAIFAEKVDVSEEITRFRSHLKQFYHFLQTAIESPGKTLDFLIQELNREVNTVGSKSSDASISHIVVIIKSELEKIREQIQNIE